jgi:predicted acetyltransferase
MVCDKENIASAKSIRRNGGILENEVLVDGVTEQRYWIELK